MPPTSIDGSEITGATIDGQDVSEITVDGQTVFTAIPDSGVSYWTLDDADTQTGSSIDFWGSNDGSINGATTGVSGADQEYATNEAYSFDGIDDSVVCGSTALDETDGFSISCWVNPDSASGNLPIVGAWDETTSDRVWAIENKNGSAAFITSSDGSFQSGNRASGSSLSGWTHLVGVYDTNGENIIYVDNSATSINRASDGLHSANIPVRFAYSPEQFGKVDIHAALDLDDVRTYNAALTPTQVSNLYNTGSIDG